MFTLEEKRLLLEALRAMRRSWWRRAPKARREQLIEKLEQMIRNEEVNAR